MPDRHAPNKGEGGPSGPDASIDHGHPSSTYPAFTPTFAQIVHNGGYVMKSPVIVPVTWDADSSQSNFESFADTLGGTSYWKATTSEYGIAPAVSGMTNHVRMSTPAPATLQDGDIQSMVTTNAGIMPGWPTPTEDTIYAFFLPPGTSLLLSALGGLPQDACSQGIGGYHMGVMAGPGSRVATAYAVVPSCNFGVMTPLQESTASMSHELIEASSDPQPPGGYTGFDTKHFAFTYFQLFQAEVGDACELFLDSFFEDMETMPAPFDFYVQRTWTNAGAAAGRNPCAPAPSGPYFNVTPLSLETVDVTVPSIIDALTGQAWANPTPTLGIHADLGKSVTLPIGFYSDGPTTGPWTISVATGNPILSSSGAGGILDMYNPSSLSVTVDKTSGVNGDKAYVTVDVKSQGALFNGEIITVSSTLGGATHYMPIWIGN